MGEPVRARICFLLASKLFDDVKEIESQLKILENSNETFISIAGTKHYKSYAPFKKGVVMNLVREPDNKFDRDAIRVEIDGETVGYVANNDYTLIDHVKSASQIKNTSSNKAEFLFGENDRFFSAGYCSVVNIKGQISVMQLIGMEF